MTIYIVITCCHKLKTIHVLSLLGGGWDQPRIHIRSNGFCMDPMGSPLKIKGVSCPHQTWDIENQECQGRIGVPPSDVEH
ncbi:hypothetical protein EUGRSUZ_E01515 [Eucalyptus grandis]|uniref:Uncharacterized protein n=2 Tax=Eucalyptus grandis TaxID=71139 RepID=A0ACC3KUM8_EUCGR|nr:hypothetical protein EUGRSUZ_E01515 [Eucalyptus grandis]